jgi:hypothetical protein
MVAKIARWAKFGSKGKRAGPASSNSHSKSKSDAKLLVEQAMSRGYLNGKPLERSKRG